MKARNVVRLAGPIVGAAGFVVAVEVLRGLWGFSFGFAVFFACAWIADRVWRRSATPEEVREDLEARSRDTSP
jgi:hypothetical protein